MTAASGRRNATLELIIPSPLPSDTSKVVSTMLEADDWEILGVAFLRRRGGHLSRVVWSKNVLRRNSWYEMVATAACSSSSSCDRVPTSAPFKPSFVLEPDILFEPDSVLDIFDVIGNGSITEADLYEVRETG